MAKQNDKMLAESMGRRRPREVIQDEVADSIMGELVPPGAIDVPVESLYRSPFQVRESASSDEIDRLAESIQTSGLISPVVVRSVAAPEKNLQVKSSDGLLTNDSKDLQVKSYEIITGHHRVQAVLRLGWTTVPVLVKHMSDAQAAIALTADNAIKKDLTDWDRYQSILMLERTGACKTGREIASTLGISTAQVSQLRAFGKLPSDAIAILQAQPSCCGYKLAYELESLGFNKDCPDLVTNAFGALVSGKIKAQNQVVQWIRLQLSSKKPRSYRRELKIQNPGFPAVRIVVTEVGATIDAKGIDAERLANLLEKNLPEFMG